MPPPHPSQVINDQPLTEDEGVHVLRLYNPAHDLKTTKRRCGEKVSDYY